MGVGDVACRTAIGALTNLIDIAQRLSPRAALTAAHHSLGIHQIDVGQAEQREVGIDATVGRVGSRLSVVGEVGPLHREVALRLVGDVLGEILRLAVGIEHEALVAVTELRRALTAGAEHAPCALHAIVGRMERGRGVADLTADDISRRTPADGMRGVDRQGEDNLVGALVVVGIEEVGIVAVERIALCDGVVAGGDAVGVMVLAGVYLRIEIELGQQRVGCSLRGAAVRTLRGRIEVGDDVLQFAFDEVEGLLRLIARRREAAHGVVLAHEGNVAEEVEGMVIEQRTHEAGLSAEVAHAVLRLTTVAVDHIFGAVAQKLIAKRDVIIDAVIHVGHPWVIGIPREVGDVAGLVAREPCAGHLVGTALLQVEERAHVVVAVVAAQVGIVAALALAVDDHRRVDLTQHGLIVAHGGIDFL